MILMKKIKTAVLYNFHNVWEIFNVVTVDSLSLYHKLYL